MLARRLVRIFGGLAIASAASGSCSVPEFEFHGTGQDGGTTTGEHCSNLLLDGDRGETDRDCGGPCPPCGTGYNCLQNSDCEPGHCINNVCQDASCADGVPSGDETGTDCGGSCQPCPAGEPCAAQRDCQSRICQEDGTCAAPSCDDKIKNGSESDVDCGGTECEKCLPGDACTGRNDCVSAECTNGVCTVVCLEGTGNCDGDMTNGCETNLKTSAAHCNACGAACSLPHAVAACSGGACVVESCVAPYLDCDGNPENGCEVNGSNDIDNCGVCGMGCTDINGSAFCASGTCQITCDTGYADCDDDRANGCEKNVQSDVNNCGSCGKICEAADGTPWCNMGTCGISDCAPGRGDCNADPADGCEVDLTSDVDNCNSCGNICVAANGTPTCSNSACRVGSCNPGFANCDTGAPGAGYANGCEVNTQNDTANCGACGATCNIANATSTCESGMCRVQSCTPPFADCNNDRTSCETNTSNNATNCGGCGANGVNCTAAFPNASGTCQSSQCAIGACGTNFLNCNGQAIDGCEVDRRINNSHCGACNSPCLLTGATSNQCTNSACVVMCNSSSLNCDGNANNGCEVNRLTDPNNCGACGTICQNNASSHTTSNNCNSGVCQPMCSGLWGDCDTSRPNGCETSLTQTTNCGACGTVCQTNAASHTTSNNCNASGVCQPMCSSGWGDCDASRTNGCETSLTTTSDCGVCGRTCGTTNTTGSPATTCPGGTCVPNCATGWAACSNPQNGCTTALGTASNCASCGNACSGGTPFCVGSPGSASCQAQLAIQLVDNTPASGSPTVVQGITGGTGTVTFMHNLRADPNTYRAIVLAMAADGNTAGSAKPGTVTYNGIAATLVHEQFVSRAWAGIYRVVIPQNWSAGSYEVVVSKSEFASLVNVAEFRGVDRITPVDAFGGSTNSNCNSTPPSSSVTTVSSNAWIYSAVALFSSGSPVGSPASSQTETMDQTSGSLGGLAGYKPNVSVGANTINWNVPTCDRGAQVLVALKPASSI